jgi:hypothetical protein
MIESRLMPADAGHEVSGRKAVEVASRKGAAKSAASAAVKVATEDTQDVRNQRLGRAPDPHPEGLRPDSKNNPMQSSRGTGMAAYVFPKTT